ncbi:hypothetical protein AAOE16_12155 [Ekhidna sp. MALMAid0563]|uniref:hypothetical protein n=1 Tax=Ekhidna sp. MALMAid0563 TaxID=3143937 RepID=UPI0032DEB502
MKRIGTAYRQKSRVRTFSLRNEADFTHKTKLATLKQWFCKAIMFASFLYAQSFNTPQSLLQQQNAKIISGICRGWWIDFSEIFLLAL